MKEKIKKQLDYLGKKKIVIENSYFIEALPNAVKKKDAFRGEYDLDTDTVKYWCADESHHNGDYYDQKRGEITLSPAQADSFLEKLYNSYLKQCEEKMDREIQRGLRNAMLRERGIL